MAGPVFTGAGGLAASAAAASLSPAKPALNTNSNGCLLAVVCSKNNAAHSTATPGWSLLSQVNSGASFTASLWIAADSAAAPTFTWTGSVACHAQIASYSDPQNTMSSSVSVSGTTGTGTTSTHSSTGFNSDVDNALAVYVDACAVSTALNQPAGWAEDVDNGSATSATRQVFGSKLLGASGSASGNISVTGGNAAWVQFQVELKGTAPASGLSASKLEALAFVDPHDLAASQVEALAWLNPDNAGFAKAEALAWLDPNDVRFAKVEILAWLDKPTTTARRRMSLM